MTSRISKPVRVYIPHWTATVLLYCAEWMQHLGVEFGCDMHQL